MLLGSQLTSAATITLGEPTPGTLVVDDTSGELLSYSLQVDGHTFDQTNSSLYDVNLDGGEFSININQDYMDTYTHNLESWNLNYDFNQPFHEIGNGSDYIMIEALFPEEDVPQLYVEFGRVVPIPATVLLFTSGLIGLFGMMKRRV
jgi:hypothetical protein